MALACELRIASQLMIAELRKHSPIFAWLLIRTWTASWPTAQRTQKGMVGCVFSCAPPAVDALLHALFCPTACRALSEARKEPLRCHPGSCIGLGSRAPGWTFLNMSFAAQLADMYLKGHVTPSSAFEDGRGLAEALALSAVRHIGRLR